MPKRKGPERQPASRGLGNVGRSRPARVEDELDSVLVVEAEADGERIHAAANDAEVAAIFLAVPGRRAQAEDVEDVDVEVELLAEQRQQVGANLRVEVLLVGQTQLTVV